MPDTVMNTIDTSDSGFAVRADAGLKEGLRSLESPAQTLNMERAVRDLLTSGRDFDPWPRQVIRRIGWLAVPAIASFLVVSALLAWVTVPSVGIQTNPFARYRVATPYRLDASLYTQLPSPPGPADRTGIAVPAEPTQHAYGDDPPPSWYVKKSAVQAPTAQSSTGPSAPAPGAATRGVTTQ